MLYNKLIHVGKNHNKDLQKMPQYLFAPFCKITVVFKSKPD